MPATDELIREAVAQLTEDGRVTRWRTLDGRANETVLVEFDNRDATVLRFLKAATPETALRELHLQRALRAANIQAPQTSQLLSGRYVGTVADTHFTFATYIEGSHPTTQDDVLYAEMGAMLALVHQAWASLSLSEPSWMSPSVALDFAKTDDSPFAQRLVSHIEVTSRLWKMNLPECAIHGDLHSQNVLVAKGQVTAVLDLETAQSAPRVIDIARTACGFAEAGKPLDSILPLVVAGYEDFADLTRAEFASLRLACQYVAGAMAAWNVFNGEFDEAQATLAGAGVQI